MKMISIAVIVMVLCSCKEKEITGGHPRNSELMQLQGVVNSGYMKRFPYFIQGNGKEWALDVIEVPSSKLGKGVSVEGRAIDVDGINVITDVVLDGVRLQTKKEWAESNREADPFGENGEL